MLSRIKDQVREYFEERGVTTADFPKAFIAYEFLSVAFFAFTWAACYQIEPSKSPMFAPINQTLRSSNNFIVVKMRQSYETVLSKAERRLGQEWFMKRGIDRGRVAVSLAESTVFRKLAKPFIIPSKLWLTLQFIEAANLAESCGEGTTDEPTGKGSSNRTSWKGRLSQLKKRMRSGSGNGEKGEGSPASEAGRRGFLGRGERGRGKRRKVAACSPLGGGGPGCFVVPPRAGTPSGTPSNLGSAGSNSGTTYEL